MPPPLAALLSATVDWTTRTVVHRIAQEAIRDAWRRDAATIAVTVAWRDAAIELDIVDDATGADPTLAMHESALTAGGLTSLADRGVTTGMLFVDAANAAAIGLYTKLGFTTHRVDRAYTIDLVLA